MSSLLRDSSWLGLALVAQTIVSLASQPVLNQSLSPAERGMISFGMLVFGITYDLVRLGSSQGAVFLIASERPFWGVVALDIAWSAFASLFAALVGYTIVRSTGVIPLSVALFAWLTQASRITTPLVSAFSGLRRFSYVAGASIIGSVFLLTSRMAFLPTGGLRAELLCYSMAVLIPGAMLLPLALKRHKFERTSVSDARELLRYARNAGGVPIGAIIVARGLPLVLLPLLGAEAAGVYVAMAVVPTVAQTGLTLLTRPLFARSAGMSPDDVVKFVIPLGRLSAGVLAVVALVAAIFADPIISLLGASRYPGAGIALPLMLIALPFRGISAIWGSHLSGGGNPQYESRATLVGAAVTLLAGAGGALLWGIRGALLGEALGACCQWAIVAHGMSIAKEMRVASLLIPRRTDFSDVWNGLRK